eukprot:152741-Chlamydomonas_euryale.AAC.4
MREANRLGAVAVTLDAFVSAATLAPAVLDAAQGAAARMLRHVPSVNLPTRWGMPRQSISEPPYGSAYDEAPEVVVERPFAAQARVDARRTP